jgi:outer membrane protein assembly factor BamB
VAKPPLTYPGDNETVQVVVQRYRYGKPKPGSWGYAPVRLSDGKPLWTIEDEDFDPWGTVGTNGVVGLAYATKPAPKAAATIEFRDWGTGEVRWHRPTRWPIFGRVLGDTVVVNDYTGTGTRVLATADGRTLWKRDSGRWRPDYEDPTSNVIYELDGSKVQAVDLHTGDVIASEKTGLGPDSRRIISFVVGERAAVVLTSVEGASAAFAPNTLQPLWRTKLPPHTLPYQESRFIVVSNDDGEYGRIDAATGDRMWTHHPSGDYLNGTNFVTAPGAIYFYGITKDRNVRVEALEAETGETRWTSVQPAVNSVSVLISDDVTYVHRQLDPPGTSFELTALDATSGEQLWSRPTPWAMGSSGTVPVDHGLLVAVADGIELLR